jgi:hypothetical protein
MRAIAWRKALACMMAAAPAAVIVETVQILALMADRDPRYRLSSFDSDWIIPLFNVYLTIFLMAHVVAFLSLYLKRGAAPLGFIGTLVGAFLFLEIVAMLLLNNVLWIAQKLPGFNEPLFQEILYCVACAIVIAVLHGLALRRLRALAAES